MERRARGVRGAGRRRRVRQARADPGDWARRGPATRPSQVVRAAGPTGTGSRNAVGQAARPVHRVNNVGISRCNVCEPPSCGWSRGTSLGASRSPEQAEAVAAAGADVVALQEVTVRTEPLWRARWRTRASRRASRRSRPPAGSGRRAARRAHRRPRAARAAASPPDVPWPERVLCCAVGDVEIINLHSPIAPAPELAKIRTHEAVAAYLAGAQPAPRVLCGDLNTPRREFPDGDVLTFAHDTNGRLRPERGERWDRAERALDPRPRLGRRVPRAARLRRREASWTFAQDRGGWRLDHVLVDGLDRSPRAYAHDWRRAGLSDHSALVVDLAVPD